MKTRIIILSLVINYLLFSQDNSFEFDNFNISLLGSRVAVTDLKNNEIFSRIFQNPVVYLSDLDEDAVNEFIVIDSVQINNYAYYTFYIFNTIDSFYLADSIYSGRTLIYQMQESEVNGPIIISGIPEFDHFNNKTAEFFAPNNIWKYDNGDLFLVNDEIYDHFMNENEFIVEYLDNYFTFNESNCLSSREVMGAITAGFANYYNAGENSLAAQFLSKFYLCEDIEKLQQELIRKINKGNFDDDGME